jgi:hypothetical protein
MPWLKWSFSQYIAKWTNFDTNQTNSVREKCHFQIDQNSEEEVTVHSIETHNFQPPHRTNLVVPKHRHLNSLLRFIREEIMEKYRCFRWKQKTLKAAAASKLGQQRRL